METGTQNPVDQVTTRSPADGQQLPIGQGASNLPETSDYEAELAHWRPIDLSVQFMLWWAPFLVLLGWWTGRPMHLLFGACSLWMH